MNYLVYKHTSPSGKSYIGITNNYHKRSAAHRTIDSGCRAFRAAIEKYGWDNFVHEILLEELSLEQANEAEERLIAEHNTMSPNGYNLTSGGQVRTASEETKQRMSATRKGSFTEKQQEARRQHGLKRRGSKLTPDQRERCRQGALKRGSTITEAGRQRKRDLMQGKQLPDFWRERIRDAVNTPEAKKKRSEAHKGVKWWNNGTICKRARECPGPDFILGRL